jgi:hypothetical protein
VKFWKTAAIGGFLQYGSVVFLISNERATHGLVLGKSLWKILRPYLPLECATLFENSPNGEFSGQIFGSNDGPVGLGFVSNQNPYLTEPAALLPLKILSGLVIQKLAGV